MSRKNNKGGGREAPAKIDVPTPTPTLYRLNPEDFEKPNDDNIIDKGGQGTVYLLKNKDNNVYAAKIIDEIEDPDLFSQQRKTSYLN